MIQFADTIIEKIVIHRIGSRHENQGIEFSKNELEIKDDTTKNLLLTYFLSPFKSQDLHRFNLTLPDLETSVMTYASQVFDFPQEFYEQSIKIAEKLYYNSNYENVKQGELYVVYFRNCEIDECLTDAIGIFKSESKDTFIQIYDNDETFDVKHSVGINIKKLEKGCIILNTEKESGYIIKTIDKSSENPYWSDDFLAIKPIEDDYFNTHNFIQICKNFSENVLTEKNNVEKNEQIGFMNKSYDYFKNNDYFNELDFKETVLQNPEIIETFSEFKHNFEETYDIQPHSEFEISKDAVKKAKKYVRSVIKLDKNFHIYVHSKPENIEKGYDSSKSMNYYKVFFENES